MGSVTLVFSRLRGHLRAYLGLAVLLGIVGGLSFIAVAGARRVQSAYPEVLAAGHASDLSVASNSGFDPQATERISRLPGVVSSRGYAGLQAYVMDHGRPEVDRYFEASASVDGLYFDQDRFIVTHGRSPDPSRVDEVAVNELAATSDHFHVGQRVELGTYSLDQYSSPSFFTAPPEPAAQLTVTIVAIGVFPNEVLQDDVDRTPRMLLTPALAGRQRHLLSYGLQGLVLRRGDADVDRVSRELTALAPQGAVDLRVTSVDTFHAQAAVRPLSIALALFGAIAGIAAVVLVGQGLVRTIRSERGDRDVLRALGLDPGAITRGGLVGPTIAILAGTALAVLMAFLASPIMPIGPLHRVAVDSGFDADPVVLGLGSVVIVLVLFCLCAAYLPFDQRRARQRRGRRSTDRPSRLAAAAARQGFRPPAVVGLRFALASDVEGGPSVSRAVMVGAAVAIAALVAAVTFGASLHSLVRQPHLYGWNWNAAVVAGDGYDNLDPDRTREILAADRHVAAWSGVYFGRQRINGRPVPLLGMEPGSAVTPPLLDGRPIDGRDEIVLGTATAATLHAGIGDRVEFGSPSRRFTVVGIGVFPTVGALHVEHVSLGVGALVVPQDVPGHDRNILGDQQQGLGPRTLFVRYRPGTDPRAELAHLREIVQPLSGFAGIDVVGVQRPAEIVNSASLGIAPVLLAAGLVTGAVLSLGLALGAAVRRHRRELAVLEALGFTSRDVGRTVVWQATVTMLVGLAIGLPVGIVLGRGLWSGFTHQLDVLDDPEVPVLILVAVALGAVVVANLVAWWPARRARQGDTPRLLRAE